MGKLPSEMSKESKHRDAIHKEHQVEELINIVEGHTRTERHLEQYSDIGDPERVSHARKIQGEREKQIENLKSAIVNKESME